MYMGNVGHLMQHWTLCELLDIAGKHTSALSFIDAHAMAPWATRWAVPVDSQFDQVRGRLENQPQSTYERAWHRLVQNEAEEGYPNSAAFVRGVWKGDFSMLLCETDQETITEIKTWLEGVRGLEKCKRAELFPDDWQDGFQGRFGEGLPSAYQLGLADGALTLVVSFDPDRYDRHWERHRENSRRLYPQDIEF